MLAIRVTLTGFTQEELDSLLPMLTESIKTRTRIAEKIYFVCHPGSRCYPALDLLKQIPIISLDNGNLAGSTRELIKLKEVLQSFGFHTEFEAADRLIPPQFQR